MKDPLLCLEIDNFGIKAQIFDQGLKHALIKDQCHILFHDLSHSDSTRSDSPGSLFDSGMDKIAQHLDLTSCSASILFVSPFFVSFRNIDLPFSSEKKAKQILPFEIETLLPTAKDTYISDFHFLGVFNKSNLFLCGSIAESMVERYFLKLESLGIKPLIIAPGGYSAVVGLLSERKDISTFIFLHITDSHITLVLVLNRKPCYVRSLTTVLLSPEDLALSVKQTIIGFNQRTGADIAYDIFICTDDDNTKSSLIPSAFDKIRAFEKIFVEYRSEFANQGAQKPLIPEKINSNAMLLNISQNSTAKYLFNFCQGKYGTRPFFKKYFSNILICAALLLCALVLSMLSIGSDNLKLEKKIAAIDDKALSIFTTTFPDKKNVQDAYLQMRANVQESNKKYSARKDNGRFSKITLVEVISELSKKITFSTDIDISRFLFNNGRLILSGSTNNFNNVDIIKSKIESSDYFKTVSISSAAAAKTGDRVNFKFIIEM